MSAPKFTTISIVTSVVLLIIGIVIGYFVGASTVAPVTITKTVMVTASPPTTTATTTPPSTTAVYSFKMPTGSPTGTYYIAAQAIAAIVSKYNPNIVIVAIPGGGSVSNSRVVGKGEVPISFATSMVAYFAYNGKLMFKGEPYPDLRAVGPIHPLIVGFIARADSDIKTIYDLAGKRVAIGEPGSGDAVVAELMLKAAGVWDKVIKVHVGDPESWDMLKTGQVDACVHHTIAPNPHLYQRSLTTPLTLIEIPDEVAEKLIKEYGFFAKAIVKKDTYNGMDRNVKVLKIPSIIIANANAPQDLVYNFIKTYWEHFDEVVKMAKFLTAVDRENPLAGIAIPLHPGAYKYWTERGIKIPPQLVPPELKG